MISKRLPSKDKVMN